MLLLYLFQRIVEQIVLLGRFLMFVVRTFSGLIGVTRKLFAQKKFKRTA